MDSVGSFPAEVSPAEEEPEWETCKENFQPLRSGRRPDALKDTTAELHSARLDAGKQCVVGGNLEMCSRDI